MRALIVDDSSFIREYLRHLLRPDGYCVRRGRGWERCVDGAGG